MLGSGQLGRMMALARADGLPRPIPSPCEDTPTGQWRTGDRRRLRRSRRRAVRHRRGRGHLRVRERHRGGGAAAEIVPVGPSGAALHITQQRARERRFSRITVFPRRAVQRCIHSTSSRRPSAGRASPAIVKTAAFGYDGKGQHRHRVDRRWRAGGVLIGHQEARRRTCGRFSSRAVRSRRGLDGAFAHYGGFENTHRNHLLDISCAGARAGTHG